MISLKYIYIFFFKRNKNNGENLIYVKSKKKYQIFSFFHLLFF